MDLNYELKGLLLLKGQRTMKWSEVSILTGGTLLVFYFTSRLFRLTLLPMFVDEASHTGRAIQIAQGQFFGVTEAGKILSIWLMSLVVPFAGDDLLWSMRLTSVGFGIFGLVGCYLLGKQLFDRRIGLLAAILYLVVPYTFFYDRIALADTLLAALAVYIVLLSVAFIRQPGLKYSLGLGVVLALASITKFNGFVLGVLPLMVIVTQWTRPIRNLPWKLLCLAYGIGALGPALLLIEFSAQKRGALTKTWLLGGTDTILELIWLLNGRNVLRYLAQNLSLLIFIIVCLGIGLAIVRRQRHELLLVGAAGVTLAVFVLTPRDPGWAPRYLLPAVPFLLLIAARTIAMIGDKLKEYLQKKQAHIWSRAVPGGLVLIIILPALWFDYWLVVDPNRAPFVERDHWQYVSGVPAGYGLREAANHLRSQLSRSKKIIVVYDGSYSPPRTLPIYLHDQQKHITSMVLNFGPGSDCLDYHSLKYLMIRPACLAQHDLKQFVSQPIPVFIVVSEPPAKVMKVPLDFFDTQPYLQRVARFDNPGNLSSVSIYQGIQ